MLTNTDRDTAIEECERIGTKLTSLGREWLDIAQNLRDNPAAFGSLAEVLALMDPVNA